MSQQVNQALACLRELGFPLNNIRKALHKLTGVTQPDMARRLNVSRPCITTRIDDTRSNTDVQKPIAAVWACSGRHCSANWTAAPVRPDPAGLRPHYFFGRIP